jgi:glucose/arabinose dehydrogenase
MALPAPRTRQTPLARASLRAGACAMTAGWGCGLADSLPSPAPEASTGSPADLVAPQIDPRKVVPDPRMVQPDPPPGGPTDQPTQLEGEFDGRDLGRVQRPIRLTRVSEHLPVATDIQAVPGHPDQLVVLQKGGIALLLDPDQRTFRVWFELPVNGGAEMGLLGLAFAPDFESSGVFYVHHSPPSGDRGRISRFATDPATLADPTPGATVLEVAQPFGNHDGGQLLFGPDGALYVALGDGGSAFDPLGHGQDGQTWLGSILRVHPLADGGFHIPADNPFLTDPDVDDAIFAIGLRNPWRMAFAPDGRLVAADVGQASFEEVNVVPPGGNLGWSRAEGFACHIPPCEGLVDPVWVYAHDDGISITGGVFSVGAGVADLAGRYVISDFGSGRFWALKLPDAVGERADEPLALGRFPIHPSTFGRGLDGRIYVADFQGSIWRLDDLSDP